MSNRVTNQEAKAFALRHNQFGKALKGSENGGPSYRTYEAAHNGDFQANHPRYPDYAYPDDQEEDTRASVKANTGRFWGATPTLQITDKDIDYLQRKEEAQQLLRFKSFVEDSIPRGTPWAKEYFEKIMPGWYQSKIDIINDKLGIIQRFVEITIRGPQSIDDMFLLYNLYQGNIALPANFADLIRNAATEGATDREFHCGLFNPRKYMKTSVTVSKRNQTFMANFAIPGIDMKGVAAAGGALAAYNNDNVEPFNVAGAPVDGADFTARMLGSRFPGGYGRWGQPLAATDPDYTQNTTLGRAMGFRSNWAMTHAPEAVAGRTPNPLRTQYDVELAIARQVDATRADGRTTAVTAFTTAHPAGRPVAFLP